MAGPRSIGNNYGGVKVQLKPVENPEGEVSDDEWNRNSEDTAHLTRTGVKVWLRFTCTATAAPVSVVPDRFFTQWGSSVAHRPIVNKLANGKYEIDCSAIDTEDELGETEILNFGDAQCEAWNASETDNIVARKLSITSNKVTIGAFSAGTLANAGASTTLIRVSVAIF